MNSLLAAVKSGCEFLTNFALGLQSVPRLQLAPCGECVPVQPRAMANRTPCCSWFLPAAGQQQPKEWVEHTRGKWNACHVVRKGQEEVLTDVLYRCMREPPRTNKSHQVALQQRDTRAFHRLATYAGIKSLRDKQLGLFFLTPADGTMTAAEMDRMENIVGEQSWSLDKQGFVVSTHDSPSPLAKDVLARAGVEDSNPQLATA